MKKRMTALLTTLLLALALCVPAMAAVEYGAIYDETEELGSVELTYQGEQTLPQLTEALGIDLRVDVFTDEGVEDSSVSDIAVYVYENSGYGCGEKSARQRTGTVRRCTRRGVALHGSARMEWRGHDHERHGALAGGKRHGGERGELPPGRRLAGRHRR